MVATGRSTSAQAMNADSPPAKSADEPAASAVAPPTRGMAQQVAQAAPTPRSAFQFFMVPAQSVGQTAHAAKVRPQVA